MHLDQVLLCTPTNLDEIRKHFGRTHTQMRQDLLLLRDWIKKEPHLPKEQSDQLLENMLILNKYSLEKTKKKLEMYYTARSIFPEMFENRRLTSTHMQTLMDTFMILPLPLLTEDHCRITIFTHITGDASKLVPIDFVKYMFVYGDVRINFDHYLNDYVLVDMSKSNLEHVKLATPNLVRNTVFVLEKAFSDRLKGVHFINCSAAAQAIVTLIKSVTKKKLAQRKLFPKDLLPKDYGGNLQHLKQLYGNWREYLAQQDDWIEETGRLKTDEKCRIGEPASLDMFGLSGSFRQLDID